MMTLALGGQLLGLGLLGEGQGRGGGGGALPKYYHRAQEFLFNFFCSAFYQPRFSFTSLVFHLCAGEHRALN